MLQYSGRSAALAVLVALFVTACGGGDSAAPIASPTSEPVVPAERVAALAATTQPAPRAEIEPLGAVAVPDVNALGLLDRTGPNATAWPQVTQPNRKTELRQLGKALFWDMQVGGDGVQACASCHFNAGADNRVMHQLNPGHASGDMALDIGILNERLGRGHYTGMANGLFDAGFPVDEPSHIALGATADGPDGTPGRRPAEKPSPILDVNDVASSQGVRRGSFLGVSGERGDFAALAQTDDLFGFTFYAPDPGMPATTRRIAARNAPSVVNAVYNLRNFWDGRADMFFNGVNTLGFRDPNARVRTFANGALADERLLVPFSSLASQALGPVVSDFEMVYSGRTHRHLGRKLLRTGVVPLAGQTVAPDDSLLGGLMAADGRGLATSYAQLIGTTFDPRFWSDGKGGDVCLDAAGALQGTAAAGACPAGTAYTLMEWNFGLFFGLAVQAYEATLVSPQTIVDLIAGGVATGVVANGSRKVDVKDVALPGCIALVAKDGSAVQRDTATRLCTAHYAKFIHPGATTGSESDRAPFPVPAGSPIGGCAGAPNCTVPAERLAAAQATLNNVTRGLSRFFSGSTACSDCHFNPEFTGATVSTTTGFGAQMAPLPQGQVRKELVQRAVIERMFAGNGQVAVYDTGFYNIGARPTAEDLSLGNSIDGMPLSYAKLAEAAVGGSTAGLDASRISAATQSIQTVARIPLSPTDLKPTTFPMRVGCSLELTGSTTACATSMTPGERLLRHGAFKAPSLRNVKFTGPYLHNGSKMSLRQVLEFYKAGSHFGVLNRNNLDAGIRTVSIDAVEESALVELLETGVTDWRVAYQQGPFDHPELCVTHGHDGGTGRTRVAGLPAVGRAGAARSIATFEEMLDGAYGFVEGRANTLQDGCTVPGMSDNPAGEGNLLVDLPPSAPTTAP